MAFRVSYLIFIGCVMVTLVNAAAIDNSVYSVEPRIRSSEELISNIVSDCFHADAMHCMKERVLIFLNSMAGVDEEQGRSFSEDNIEKVIVDRVGRILNTNEFRLQLPQTFFQSSVMTYRADRGFDLELPTEGEARGLLLKKKLLLPVLLLMKLKMKLLMPLIVMLVGLKATKALILSKIAIKLVLGFLIYNLVKKLGGMKMNMMPMMPMPEPMTAYGAPISSTTASSYDPASWEPMSGGPYARWDSTHSGSAHNLAYSSYYPSSSSYSSGSSSGSSSSSSASSPSSSYSSSS
ncbi:uncharacterized protein LOC129916970 [Episyrphus balteatus]|uniref:uncharacterized protein LOC129916970 n=1 Tax=Episyrphus balteatus TaxID=286459 RepID=UPI0024855F65|nr:uncharacterized protein LOC129916970 [Episyrphus balteatus]